MDRLRTLEITKDKYLSATASTRGQVGQIKLICADLSRTARLPFRASSLKAVVCVHFPIVGLVGHFTAALRVGGYVYFETFGGQGGNYVDLPRKGVLRSMLEPRFAFRFYNEKSVGPSDSDAVSVRLFARKMR